MQLEVADIPRFAFGFANPNHVAVDDLRGQLVAVKEGGSDIERYVYDKAGNMIMKVVRGSRFVVRDGVECAVRDGEYKTTTFTFDDANQLVSSTCDGVTTRYEYDAAGRMIKEGDKTDGGGLLFAVVEVTERKAVFVLPGDPASPVENRHSGVVIGRHLTGAAVF